MLLVVLGLVFAGPALAAEPDTTRSLIEDLQQGDRDFFSDELFEVDEGFQDSVLTTLDSLGFLGFEAEGRKQGKVEVVSGPATRLMTYNRVEGLVAGIELGLERERGWRLAGQVAYSTAPQQMRHYEYLRVPFRTGLGDLEAEIGYTERVVPYGSNRPTANWLRTLVGSADEQDYLKSEGGWGTLRLTPSSGFEISAGYEAADERSVAAQTQFAFFGSDQLMAYNAPIDEGIDRSVSVGLELGHTSETRQWLGLSHRVAGGGLGGDFEYTRFDGQAEARRFVLTGWEVHGRVAGSALGGSPPVQRVADVGGLSTVRGFDRRAGVGLSSLAGRVEIWLPYDPLRATRIRVVRDLKLQFVAWGDAGRVWEGTTEDVLGSAGAGVQRYLGPFGSGSNLRFDVAFPMGSAREHDIVLYVHFTPGYF